MDIGLVWDPRGMRADWALVPVGAAAAAVPPRGINLLRRTRDLAHTPSWGGLCVVARADGVAVPDGSGPAWLVEDSVPDIVAQLHQAVPVEASPGSWNVAAVRLRAADSPLVQLRLAYPGEAPTLYGVTLAPTTGATFGVTQGAVAAATPLGGDWWRLQLAAPNLHGVGQAVWRLFPAASSEGSTGGVLVAGPQLQPGATPGAYVPTDDEPALDPAPASLGGTAAIGAGDLLREDGLRTAVALSLFTDATARPDDPLPDGAGGDRRGWWGDLPLADGQAEDPIGSRLWLLAREKRTEETRLRAERYAREALEWMVRDGVAARVDVAAAWGGDRGEFLLLRVAVLRDADGRRALERFDFPWSVEASR